MVQRRVDGPAGALATWAVGDGEVTILLGGGPGLSWDYLFPLAERLADGGRAAVCFQQRGIAPSAWPDPFDFSLRAFADDVFAICDAYGAERAHLVAHSFGGYVAWTCLAQPERVCSLTLINACSPDGRANREGEAKLRRRLAGLPAAADATERFRAAVPAYFHAPPARLPRALRDTQVHTAVRDAVLAANNADTPLTAHAAAYAGPVRIFVGASDPLGFGVAEACREAMVRAAVRFEVIPRAGHFPWLEAGAVDFNPLR